MQKTFFIIISFSLVIGLASACQRSIPSETLVEMAPEKPFDDDGFDKSGFDKDGYNREGYNRQGIDRKGYDRRRFHSTTRLHEKTKTKFDPHGYDYQNFNMAGFHKNTHLHRDTKTAYNPAGYDYQGYDLSGFHKDTHFHRATNGAYNLAGHNYLGFDANGVDQLGLSTPQANAYREPRIANFLTSLKNNRFELEDAIMLTDINDLGELKDAYNNLRQGGAHAPTPSDKDLHNDLKKLDAKVTNWRALGMRIDDVAQLKHQDAMVRRQGQFLDFQQLWRDTENNIIGPKDAFYKKIYDALNDNALLGETNFPDPADAYLNGRTLVDIQKKRDYLIIALASIKNPNNNQELTPLIRSATWAPYSTGGNSPLWFATQRVKLYHFSEAVDTLTPGDKKTAISFFLHAGKHCSDAKHDQFEGLLALFNNAAHQQIEQAERALAVTLQEKMEMVATRTKTVILQRLIDSLYTQVIDIANPRPDLTSFNNVDHVRNEGITYKAGTWDRNAPRFGLPLRHAAYPNLFLHLDQNNFFAAGNYTERRLLNEIKGELAQDLVREYSGSLDKIIGTAGLADKIILGALIERGFFENR